MSPFFEFLMNVIFDALYFLPMTYLGVAFGHGLIGVEKVTPLFALLYVGITLFYMAVRHVKRKTGLLLCSLLLELLIVVVFLQKAGTRTQYLREHAWVLWLFLAIAVIYVLVELLHRFLAAKIAFLVLIVAGLTLLLVFKTEMTRVNVAAALFLVLLLLVEIVQYFWKKKGYTDKKTHLVRLAPFFILIFILAAFTRPHDEPYDWYFFRKIYAGAVTFFDKSSVALFHGFGDSYEHARVGFSENGGILYGMLSNRPSDLMEADPGYLEGSYIYLAGKTYDTFDGQQWVRTNESACNSDVLDAVESYASVFAREPELTEDYIRRQYIEISYRYFNSRYVFLPMKALTTTGGKYFDLRIKYRGDDLLSNTMVNYNDEYIAAYYRLNQDHPEFVKLVNTPRSLTREIWNRALAAVVLYPEDQTPYSYEDYRAYQTAIYETYLSTPELTGRTREWLTEVIGDAETDYDKLLRLEAAFADWEYTLSPGLYPEEISSEGEWLDRFLFEGRQGYCIYYATAYTILARALGIPARYVEGFAFEAEGTVTTVDSGMAHAWPEVYLRDFGWIRMEPTPGKKVAVIWETKEERDSHKSDPTGLPPEEYEEEEKLSDIVKKEEKEEEPVAVTDPRMILIPAVILLVTALLVLCIRLLILRRHFENADNASKLLAMHQRNRFLLKELGAELRQGETLAELKARASAFLPVETMSYFRVVEGVLYGGEKVTVKSLLKAELSYEEIYSELKKKKGLRCWLIALRGYVRMVARKG